VLRSRLIAVPASVSPACYENNEQAEEKRPVPGPGGLVDPVNANEK